MTHKTALRAATALATVLSLIGCNVDADADGTPAHLDCDDTRADTFPGADELCDGLDNDCDGAVDEEAVDGTVYFADKDGDSFGDPDTTTTVCAFSEDAGGQDPDFLPAGYVLDNTDCDDSRSAVNPAADEYCDEVDQNCDGDPTAGAVDPLPWYKDADGDLFGDAATTETACNAPEGFVADDSDCNDEQKTAYPGAPELCDGFDNDCDTLVDEDSSTDARDWYADSDMDGYGDPSNTTTACAAPPGFVDNDLDCHDDSPTSNPDGTEVCDGFDNDCDPLTSEAGTLSINATDTEFVSIQLAIETATAGDTVYVCEGTWAEQLKIDKSITLVGAGGSDRVILDPMSAKITGPVISVVTTDPTTIRGFTVQSGDAFDAYADGCVDASGAGDITLDDMVIQDCDGFAAALGGPIGGGTLSVSNSLIQNNTSDVAGGVVMASGKITDSRILDNVGGEAGGLFVAPEGEVDLTGTEILSNYTSGQGGGIQASAETTVTGGIVKNNTAFVGGGVYTNGDLDGVTIENNEAALGGGGIYLDGPPDQTVEDCTIKGNKAERGGGIVGASSDWKLIDSVVSANESATVGGGLFQNGEGVTIESCEFTLNSADQGGGVFVRFGPLSVTTTDWGSSTSSDDNTPNDIEYSSGETYDSYGAGETFECDETGSCM